MRTSAPAERGKVMDPMADAFVEKLAAKVATRKTGAPLQEDTPLGTLISALVRPHRNALITDAAPRCITLVGAD